MCNPTVPPTGRYYGTVHPSDCTTEAAYICSEFYRSHTGKHTEYSLIGLSICGLCASYFNLFNLFTIASSLSKVKLWIFQEPVSTWLYTWIPMTPRVIFSESQIINQFSWFIQIYIYICIQISYFYRNKFLIFSDIHRENAFAEVKEN